MEDNDLLLRWKGLSPSQFEAWVLRLYRQLGYDGYLTGRVGDSGVDARLSREAATYVLQCKRYLQTNIGEPTLRDLLGTVIKQRVSKGIIVTTAGFTHAARQWARGVGQIQLVDGEELIRLAKLARMTPPDGPSSRPTRGSDGGGPRPTRADRHGTRVSPRRVKQVTVNTRYFDMICPLCGKPAYTRKDPSRSTLQCSNPKCVSRLGRK